MVQWNGYEPGFVGAVNVLVPGEAASLNALPVSAVTVCAVPSLLSTVIVAPGLTESGAVKLKLLIVMVEAVPPAWGEDDEPEDDELEVDELEDAADDEDGEPDEPQATSVIAHRPARTSRAGAWVTDTTRPLSGRSSVGDSNRDAPASRHPERECGRGAALPRRRAVALRARVTATGVLPVVALTDPAASVPDSSFGGRG
jgi:hypothetical protein